MNNKTKIVVGAVVIFLVAGIGGYEIGKSRAVSTPGQFGASARNGQGITNRRGGGGVAGGEILTKDAKSLTIKLASGGSRIVFYSNSTEVSKTVSSSIDNLSIGENVSVAGTAGADGSLVATSIFSRPAGSGPVRAQ